MCLTVNINFKTRKEAREYKPLIAKKDIRVYKILNLKNNSPYFSFYYEKGCYYNSNFSKLITNYNRWLITINKGLHSFIKYREAKNRKNNLLHSDNFKIVIMYIPKGSEYYLGKNGDVVSNNLVWY